MDSSDPKEIKVEVVESRHARSLHQVTASRPGHRGRGAPCFDKTKENSKIVYSNFERFNKTLSILTELR